MTTATYDQRTSERQPSAAPPGEDPGLIRGSLALASDGPADDPALGARPGWWARPLEEGQAAEPMELLALMSHELRGPLASILGHAELLLGRSRTLAPLDVESGIKEIQRSAGTLQGIIENMLVLACGGGRDTRTDLEPVLLQRQLPAAIAANACRSGRPIIADVPESLPAVLANPGFIEQLLGNLLNNAEKYGTHPSPTFVRCRVGSGEVLTTVENDGPRIAAGEVSQFFTPFYRRPETAGAVRGLGLGLAVCRRLTQAQGGRITATALPLGGLSVSFSLPVCPF